MRCEPGVDRIRTKNKMLGLVAALIRCKPWITTNSPQSNFGSRFPLQALMKIIEKTSSLMDPLHGSLSIPGTITPPNRIGTKEK